jgi:hypothetical protein
LKKIRRTAAAKSEASPENKDGFAVVFRGVVGEMKEDRLTAGFFSLSTRLAGLWSEAVCLMESVGWTLTWEDFSGLSSIDLSGAQIFMFQRAVKDFSASAALRLLLEGDD